MSTKARPGAVIPPELRRCPTCLRCGKRGAKPPHTWCSKCRRSGEYRVSQQQEWEDSPPARAERARRTAIYAARRAARQNIWTGEPL